jgi:hypothetical protein
MGMNLSFIICVFHRERKKVISMRIKVGDFVHLGYLKKDLLKIDNLSPQKPT